MDRIVIEVEDSLARKWRNTPLEVKNDIGKSLEKQLGEILRDKRHANFDIHLEQTRNEAASNGLTEEILQRLLDEE